MTSFTNHVSSGIFRYLHETYSPSPQKINSAERTENYSYIQNKASSI